MKSERWKRVKEILGDALDRPLTERAAYLDHACGDDHGLRLEVESLLIADDDAGTFLHMPALESANAVGWRPIRTNSACPLILAQRLIGWARRG